MIEAVIIGVFERRDHRPAIVVLAERDECRRQSLGIGIDRIAEQDELHERHAQHHAEGDAVAPHLDELLDQQGNEPTK